MRTKLLCLLGAVAALTAPTAGHADVGARTQVFEMITLQADVVVPIAAHLTVTTRVHRYAALTAKPPKAPVLLLDDASSYIELRDLNGDGRICWSAAPMATVTVEPSDAVSAATTDMSCPLQLEATGSGDPRPYANNPSLPGAGAPNSAEFGYTRTGTVTSAVINGENAVLENVTITRSRRVLLVPETNY